MVIILSPAHGQTVANHAQGDSETPAKLADAERAEAQGAPAGKDAPKGAPITADALSAYLRQIIEAQGATIAALQAQAEALKAQQTLQQAAAVAQQAQQSLGDAVAKMAKESGAADGARLALDETWIPPAESQATQ